MPLYIVRWPGLRASLIKARSADELVLMIDEEGNPGQCTWREYRGPVWVDFHVQADFHLDESVQGRFRPEKVVVEDVSRVADEPLVGSFDASAESAVLLSSAILEIAFPNLGEVLADEVDRTDVEHLRRAVVDDLVEHEEAVFSRGVALSSELGIKPARLRTFRRTAPGRFEEIEPARLDDFIFGRAPLEPEGDGLVRAAQVSFALKGRRPARAALGPGLALRAGADGTIDPAHRADAFAGHRGGAPDLPPENWSSDCERPQAGWRTRRCERVGSARRRSSGS